MGNTKQAHYTGFETKQALVLPSNKAAGKMHTLQFSHLEWLQEPYTNLHSPSLPI
jgi:hypothetical protein